MTKTLRSPCDIETKASSATNCRQFWLTGQQVLSNFEAEDSRLHGGREQNIPRFVCGGRKVVDAPAAAMVLSEQGKI